MNRGLRYGLVSVLRCASGQAVRACRGNIQPGAAAAEAAAPGPHVKGTGKGKWRFAWGEPLGLDECPYVIRWIAETPWLSVRVHHWIASDDPRGHHDHPWSFLTFVLRGGYEDRSPDGTDYLKAPAVRFRSALHRHYVYPDEDGCWTLLLTGPIIRPWGFWVGEKFTKANKWFLSKGHHPCS